MAGRGLGILLGIACLVVAACRADGPTSPRQSFAASPGDVHRLTVVHLTDFRIQPVRIVSGPAVAFEVVNDGPTPHTLTVRDEPSRRILLTTPELRPGTETRLIGTIAPGTYTLFCALPGHESLGMRATLVVERGAGP